jgi:pimeloyl-ACP methyl ester carboxylesterase
VLREHQRARFASPPSLAGYHLQMLAISGWTSVPWLHTIRAPTLVLAGDDDPLIPVFNSRLLCWLIPDCRVHIVRGGGHLFMIDQTVDAIGPLQEFLATARAA